MFRSVYERFMAKFGPSAVADWLAEILPNFISAIVTFAFFWLAWFALSFVLNKAIARFNVDRTLASFIRTAVKSVILIVGGVAALGELGIDTVSLMTSLGVAGLTIGFAAKDALSNLISGIFIFWDRPFVIGDLIEVEDNYGRVEQITLRSTRVVTVDGKMLAIPNTIIVNTAVASYTNFPHLRLNIDVTLGVDEDLDRARAIWMDLVRDDERFLDDPPPQMVLTALNDYNLAVQFRVWAVDEKQHLPLRFELRERIYKRLLEAGVEMPNETIAIHLKQDDSELEDAASAA